MGGIPFREKRGQYSKGPAIYKVTEAWSWDRLRSGTPHTNGGGGWHGLAREGFGPSCPLTGRASGWASMRHCVQRVCGLYWLWVQGMVGIAVQVPGCIVSPSTYPSDSPDVSDSPDASPASSGSPLASGSPATSNSPLPSDTPIPMPSNSPMQAAAFGLEIDIVHLKWSP